MRVYESKPPAERLWARIDRAQEGCWSWPGSTSYGGYGTLSVGHNGIVTAHRIAYESEYGPIPKGMWVLHSCDNRLCVRPDHLRLGTRAENVNDMLSRRRQAVGERHGRVKLSANQVQEMRRLRTEGMKLKDLAARFGVGITSVCNICKRRTWAWLD